MMRKIIERSHGHPLKNQKILLSHVCLISIRNIVFARLLAQMIKLQAQFPDYPITAIKFDNANEFTSQTFIDYCMSVGINVEHHDAYTHTQNGLVESLIKHL